MVNLLIYQYFYMYVIYIMFSNIHLLSFFSLSILLIVIYYRYITQNEPFNAYYSYMSIKPNYKSIDGEIIPKYNSIIYDVSETGDAYVSTTLIKLTNNQNLPKVDSFIVYDTKKIPVNNSVNSGINNVYMYETATIKSENDYINIYALYPNSESDLSGLTTVPKQTFAVNSATGIFKNFKKVLIDYDNDGTATWNKNNIKYFRRLTFLK
jgi:hypothetical protein